MAIHSRSYPIGRLFLLCCAVAAWGVHCTHHTDRTPVTNIPLIDWTNDGVVSTIFGHCRTDVANTPDQMADYLASRCPMCAFDFQHLCMRGDEIMIRDGVDTLYISARRKGGAWSQQEVQPQEDADRCYTCLVHALVHDHY